MCDFKDRLEHALHALEEQKTLPDCYDTTAIVIAVLKRIKEILPVPPSELVLKEVSPYTSYLKIKWSVRLGPPFVLPKIYFVMEVFEWGDYLPTDATAFYPVELVALGLESSLKTQWDFGDFDEFPAPPSGLEPGWCSVTL